MPSATARFAGYEGGERRIDVIEFIAIARALEADPERLLAVFLSEEREA